MKLRACPLSAPSDVFVAHDDGSFTCGDCTPSSVGLGDPRVEVWTVGSHGWTGPVVCRECTLSIRIYIDGNHEDASNAPTTKDTP